MISTYLRLLQLELAHIRRKGGIAAAEEFLTSCSERYRQPELKVKVALERAKLSYLTGKWDDCLSLLDKVELHDHLLQPEDRAYFFITSARLHYCYGDLNQSLAFLEMALGEAEETGPAGIETCLEMASLFNRIGEQERGDDFLQRAEQLLQENPVPRLASRLAFERGLVYLRTEGITEAREFFEESLTLLKSIKPSVSRGEGLRFLGILEAMDSRPLEALEYQKSALDCFQALPYPFGAAKAFNSLGQTCMQLGRFEEAQLFLQKAEEICRELGAEAERAMILGKLGAVFSKKGDFEKAITYQKQDLDLSSRFGNYRALAFSLRNLGLSYKAKGDLAKAVKYLRDSRDRFSELEDYAYLVKADLDLVSALLEHDRITEAFGFLQDAQEHLERRMEGTSDHVNARYYAGLISFHTEKYHQAEKFLWQTLEMCQPFGMHARQADIHYHLAKLYLTKRDPGAAQLEFMSAYRLSVRHSLGELRRECAEQLMELDPEGFFQELLLPG